MSLLHQTASLIAWIVTVLGRFLHVCRPLTVVVVGSSLVARKTRMLTFLLPLKVILLAGSDGVPRYFQFFVSPELRTEWVAGLSLAAVICYLVTLFLEAQVTRLSLKGSEAVTRASGVMTVVPNQSEQAGEFFERFSFIASGILFVLGGALVIALLNPLLLAFLAGCVAVAFAIAALAMVRIDPLKPRPFSDFVTEKNGPFLSLVSSIAFLSSFLVILLPFLVGSNGNVLIAIISIILVRTMLVALIRAIRDGIVLLGKRALVDMLFFPSERLAVPERKTSRTMREIFARSVRESVIADKLASLKKPDERLEISWAAPTIRGTVAFAIAVIATNSEKRHYQMRAFPPRFEHNIANEELLFSHISRDAVWAAPLVKRFRHVDCECLVWEAGEGVSPAETECRAWQIGYLTRLWSIAPPPALVETYCGSHNLLPQRLSEELVSRMDIAVDSDEKATSLERLQDRLPHIRDILSSLPLTIVREKLECADVLLAGDSRYLVLGWGQWSIEPLGGGQVLVPALARNVTPMFNDARAARNDIPAAMTVQHILLARTATQLESAILRGRLDEALNHANRLVSASEPLSPLPTGSSMPVAPGA